ncbi:competence protein CoiA family protein [Streptomyces goshikiensis]|uniref:competence protein CoiA family protein n=1 Tax=Streptomyces goshikiensis TaxID=1942 RepID=UPI00364A0B66
MLKLEMAGATRPAGWFATLEVPAEDGSWRADVMASSTDGNRRLVWEAQLSPITVDDIAARTDRYAKEGIRVCWVYPGARPPQWITAVSAVRVRAPQERNEPWQVDDGLAGFVYRSGRWKFQEEPLERFVRWALEEQLVSSELLPRYRRMYLVVDGEQRRFRRDRWWTSQKSIADQGRHEVMRQRQDAARAEREARQKEQEEAAERRRREVEEQERAREAEEAERRRLERDVCALRRRGGGGRRKLSAGSGRGRSARRVWPGNRPSVRSRSARTWRRRGRGGAGCRRSSRPSCLLPSLSTPDASQVFGWRSRRSR